MMRGQGRDPLVAPFLAALLGVILAVVLHPPVVALCGVLTLTAAVSFAFFHFRFPRLGKAAGLSSAAVLGALLAQLHSPPKPPIIDFAQGEVLLVSGCVVEPPVFSQDREQFLVELEPGARMRVTAALRPDSALPALDYGQRVEFPARLRKPRNFGNPGAFDYERYLAQRETYWLATVSDNERVRVLHGSCGTTWRTITYGIRQSALQRLDTLYAGDDFKRSMMRALLLGDATSLQAVWTDHFRRTGTYHALVISGAHISVLAGAFLFLFRLCRIPLFAALATTAGLAWLYAVVAGGGAPVVRSAAGFTVYVLTRFFFRRVRVLNLLAVVGWSYLFIDPYQIFEASFQLSFLSVAVLGAFAAPVTERTTGLFAAGLGDLPNADRDVTLSPRIAAWRIELRLFAETISLWTRLPQRIVLTTIAASGRVVLFAVELALISALIQAALALPMVAYFHRLSLSGLSANVVATPILTLAVPVGFIALATGWIAPAWIAGEMLTFAQRVVAWHANLEPNWRVPDPPIWLAAGFCALVMLTAWLLRRRSRWAWATTAAALAGLALIVIHPFQPRSWPGWLEVTAIDVGQGESLFIAFPDSTTMLVDGGGIPVFGKRAAPRRLDIGEDVVSPYLWSRGIRRLNIVVLTHAHEDHSGGLPAVIRNFRPREVWTGPAVPCSEWDRIVEAARETGTRIVHRRAGDSQNIGGVQMEAMAPLNGYQPGSQPENPDSLVLRLTFHKRSVLLTGDTDRRTLGELAYAGALRHIDILKAAHHGSKTSNDLELFNLLQPSYTLISAGYQNSYRLPNPSVIESLKAVRSEILRTDQLGAITIRTDGDRIHAGPAQPDPQSLALLDPF